jgi:glyoxylase-like metal-dependent hydrolase (beta-lactamase superfamily II)
MHALTRRTARAARVALALLLGLGAQAQPAAIDPLRQADAAAIAAARGAVARENPQLMKAITRGGSFSGESFSQAIANNMYSRSDAAAIADARAKLKVEPQGPRSWLLRLPFVNIAVFETDAGLVLIDSGYAPAGPALRDALKSLSDKPVHTIVHTHYHADHAWGAWALMDMGPGGAAPRIVTTEEFIDQMGMDLRSWGLVQRNNQQRSVPRSWDDVIRPTLTFHGRTTLTIGGEDFVLTHARGETEDQLWAWLPSRRIVVSADYLQDFLPNAGNGKRRQRFVEDWAQALRDMAALRPARVLTMHGPALSDEAVLQDKLAAHAAALDSIAAQTLAGLNTGQRVDQVVEAVALPPALAQRPDLRPDYVTAQDISRMVVKQYGGWWDDIPSHWNPAPLAKQAQAIAAAAGGAHALIERAKQTSRSDPAVAAALADWAWLAAPGDAVVLQGALDVYGARVDEHTTTQEALVYLEHMIRLKLALAELARAHAAPK